MNVNFECVVPNSEFIYVSAFFFGPPIAHFSSEESFLRKRSFPCALTWPV